MAKREFSKLEHVQMFVEAMVLFPLIHLISFFIPYKKIYSASKVIGRILLKLAPSKKDIIRKNLTIITPEKTYSQEEFEDICQVIAGYELRILLEMIALSKMDFQDIISCIQIEQHDQLAVVYNKKQIIAFTMHYGNWELLGTFMANFGMPLSCLVERQFNPFIDRYLQNIRKKMSILTIYNEISEMRPLLQYLKKGGSVALVADQTHWFDPLFIKFFSKEAAVPRGAASLALKTKLTLAYGCTTYINNGTYSFEIDTDINNTDSIEKLMEKVYTRYEKNILNSVKDWYTLGTDRWALTPESLEEWKKNPDSSQF